MLNRQGFHHWLNIRSAQRLRSGSEPVSWRNAHPNIVPNRVFKVADGWVIVACCNDGQFRKLTQVAGLPELADAPRFASDPARVRHRDQLVPLLEALMLQRERDEWIRLLEAVGVPCGPINDMADVFKDPQVLARGMRQELPHPTADQISVPGSALKLSAHVGELPQSAPLLGQHTHEVLQSLAALSDDEPDALKNRQII